MASRVMPRLMAWVARVCRSWCGWMWASPAAVPALLISRVTVCRSSGRPFSRGSSSGLSGGDVRGAVVADEGDQVRVQRQVAVLVEFADRDVQPVRGADEHDRVGAQGGELADA